MSGAYLSANGQRLTSINLALSYYGIAVADVALAGASVLAGAVSLVLGNLTLAMSVMLDPATGSPRSQAFAGVTTARLVAGAGGWAKRVALPPYRAPGGVQASRVLADVALAAGERVSLAPGTDRSLGALYVTEPGASAGKILWLIAGSLWWIDASGTTHVAATRPTGTIGSSTTVDNYDAATGILTVATEDLAAWVPGATYASPMVPAGVTVCAVRMHANNDGRMRVEAMVA